MTRNWETRDRWTFLLGCVALLLSVNYFPNLPNASLDSSWMNGLNVALASDAVLGRDVLFTYGPLAAMTTAYWGQGFFLGLALSLAIAVNLAFLLRGAFGRLFLPVVVLVFLLVPGNEALFFVFLLALPLAVFHRHAPAAAGAAPSTRRGSLFAAVVLLPALTLSKLSYAPVSAVVLLFTCIYMAYCGRKTEALLTPFVAIASMVVFWLLSGQALGDLPTYLFDGEIIAGYTNAMEWDMGLLVAGINLQLAETALLYLLGALLLSCITRLASNRAGKLYLLASLAAVLAVVFKVGVVRHGGSHSMIAWTVLAALAIHFLAWTRRDLKARSVLTISLVASAVFSVSYSGDGSGMAKLAQAGRSHAEAHAVDWQTNKKSAKFWMKFLTESPSTFYGALPPVLMGGSARLENASGLASAVSTSGRSVSQAVTETNAQINAVCEIPHTAGSADIYPVDINCLTAAGIRWTPRPVFQSYSAYTPKLIQANLRHLQPASAPDHVYLAIKPIDDRLPSLEDGHSWACMAANYRPDPAQPKNFLLLTRVASPQACPGMQQVSSRSERLGQVVQLGCQRGNVFASLHLTRSPTGRLASVFYKTRRLAIDLKLCGGGSVTYKFVPTMAELPLLLSPLVTSTGDFAKTFFGNASNPATQVESFVVRYADSESPIHGWNPEFDFKTYEPQRQVAASAIGIEK